MNFNCPQCQMLLQAPPQWSGRVVNCPACGGGMQVPIFSAANHVGSGGAASGSGGKSGSGSKGKQEDPGGTSVPPWTALGIGVGLTVGIVLLLLPFEKTFLGQVFFTGGWVNYAELFLFAWGMAILFLKIKRTKLQRDALLLDVLPRALGTDIDAENVSVFLDHLAKLPSRVRHSLMVARIRHGLELFQARGKNEEVAALISAQSDVDANRQMGTFSLLKVFLWAIPILGFIGTVLGLSVAMQNFGSADLADAAQLKKSVSDITAGLATAFNTTLLGLVLSMLLVFPMSAMQKREDDLLTDIDAFCSGVLLPRLNDGTASPAQSPVSTTPASPEWMEQVLERQGDFLQALISHTETMRDVANQLEQRSAQHDQKVQAEFTKSLEKLTETCTKSIAENVKATGSYFNALHEGITALNVVLKELDGKQVVLKKKKGFWG